MTLDALPAAPRLPREIAAALARGAQVLTASVRAARALSRALAEDTEAGWLANRAAPAIRDWAGWLQQMYETIDGTGAATPFRGEPGVPPKPGRKLPLLLTPLQEELLWKRVQSAEGRLVVSPSRLARLAQEAYQLLSGYDAHSSRNAPWAAAHEDAEHFLRWSSAFDALCTQLHVQPQAQLEAALREHATAIAVALQARRGARELLLVGFDRLTPSEQRLLDALDRAGVHAQQAALQPPAQPRLVCAADEQQELHACARWVRARLETGPHQRIAVLLPELAGARAELDRVFRRVLLPESARQLYEFSLGAPLASLPLIAAALLLLRWLAGPLPAAEITSLLVGGFLAHDPAEAEALARTDATLRKAGLLTTRLSLASLLRHAEATPELLPPGVHARLRAASLWAGREAAARQCGYAEWVEAAGIQLATLDWPGFRALDSLAYQARQRWETLLTEVARLGFAGGSLSWSAFVGELTGFAQRTLFAAESRNAPVQILGAAEASGQRFDAIWFLQVTEARWPPGGRMHPLLAPGVQRDAGMPHSSAEADLQLAEEQLRRIAASAPVVVVSYARQSGGVDARPSPLLRQLGEATAAALPEAAPVSRATVHDPEPATVVPWPLERVAGGSDILKRQAACGFQSFAVKRLGAQALEEESWGLDAGERAILLHAALEQLWSVQPVEPGSARLHTSEDLARAYADGTLDAILRAAIACGFQAALRAADPWHAAYLALEQQRLHTRLKCWLEVERQRAPFRVVGLEKRMQAAPIAFDTGELRLNLRADRVDTVGEQTEARTLIVDYKTAATVGPALWEGDRPDEPQLPIYALFGGIENVAGIAFAQIRAGRTALHALAADPAAQLGPLAKEAGNADKRLLLAETRDEWDRALRSLASQFARGEAPVNPKHGARTCQFCGLFGLCRVRSRERGALAEDLDEDSNDA